MDFLKVLDQTMRDLKREVNLNILKVPEIEQKVLDATSNEAWGPHGTLMLEIAQATRNYSEYQIIMPILWTRVGDTGKNWRHVYKALTVMEFLVANGSEKVIEDIREHSYQLTTLADFQYVEPNGKDQGINVRKKAQALMDLVHDRDKIKEVRQKAAANRDKYRGLSSSGYSNKSNFYHSSAGGFSGSRYRDNYGGTSEEKNGDNEESGSFRDEDGYDMDRHEYIKEDDHMTGDAAGKTGYQLKIDDDSHSASGYSKPHAEVDDLDDFDPRGGEDEFDPRVSTVQPSTQSQAPVPSLLGDDLFSVVDPPVATNTSSGDLFGDFVTSASLQPPTSEQLDNFGVSDSLFNMEASLLPASFPSVAAVPSPPSAIKSGVSINLPLQPPMKSGVVSINPPPPPPPITAAASSNCVGNDAFDAFAFDSMIQNAMKDDPFDGITFGAFQSETGPAFESNVQTAAPVQLASNGITQESRNCTSVNSKPTQKDKFELKSSVWTDSLSKGLIDLNLGSSKSTSLADIGIEFDLLGAERTKEERAMSAFGKGKAMGAGSGLGLAGASDVTRPSAPMVMNNMAPLGGMAPTVHVNTNINAQMGFSAGGYSNSALH